MDLFLDPEAGKPLTTQLYEQLRRAITGGRLLPGDQLVPSRQLAGELGVSRHTVTTAYGRRLRSAMMRARLQVGAEGGPSHLAPAAAGAGAVGCGNYMRRVTARRGARAP